MNVASVRGPARWLVVAGLCSLAINGLLMLGLRARGESAHQAWSATAAGQLERLRYDTGLDSWEPMAEAYQHVQDHPRGSLYDVFFDENVKFQYPPSALIAIKLLPGWLYAGPASIESGTALRRALTMCSLGICVLTILLSLRLLGESTRQRFAESWRHQSMGVGGAAIACALGACFYPLLKGHTLGQIQVLIGLVVATGLVLTLTDRRGWAGLCFGLCALVKPQYGVVLLGSCLRRDWTFSFACVSIVAVGLATSVWMFGWTDHLRYLEVLQYISLHGESFWPNQSINGLMNRILSNGEAVRWTNQFPPYHPIVYGITIISSAAIIAAAVWATRRTHLDDSGISALDLSILLMASTMAAPIAWEHHYGVWLPIFAVVTPVLIQTRPAGAFTAPLLLLSFLMMANVVLRPEALNSGSAVLVGSHLFWGALTLFVLCLVCRSRR